MSVTDKYMEVVFADDTDPNAMKKPAKAWRNWWLVVHPHSMTKGRDARPGDKLVGEKMWPSKDTAETRAAFEMASPRYAASKGLNEYLGAFPEGERP